MPFESADAEAALALFQKLTATGAHCPAALGEAARDFLRARSLGGALPCQGEARSSGFAVRAAADVDQGNAPPELLLAAQLPTSSEAEIADLAAVLAIFAALARARPGRRLAFAVLEGDVRGGQAGARALAEAHPWLMKAENIAVPSPEAPFALRGQQVLPLVTAFKGRALIELSAQGAPGTVGQAARESAAYRLTRGLLRLGNQGLPIHATPEGRQMFRALHGRARGPLALRLLACGPLVAGLALENLDRENPLASRLAAALRNTAEPLGLALDPAPKPGEIPAAGRAQLDGRFLPGQGVSALLFELRAILDDGQLALQVCAECPPAGLAAESPLAGAIARACAGLAPDLCPVPWLSAQAPDAALFARSGTPFASLPLLGSPGGDDAARALWLRAIAAMAEALSTPIAADRS